MSKPLKIILYVLGILAVLAAGFRFVAFPMLKNQTKKKSPEQTVQYAQRGLDLEVYYNRPSKKGREIFAEAGLVPLGEVWRTGANEATTFETGTALKVGGKELPAGKYSLWTIPGADEWTIIFNEKMYGWGVGFGAQASVDREADVLSLTAPVEKLSSPVDTFTIKFEEGEALKLSLLWDDTKVSIPVSN